MQFAWNLIGIPVVLGIAAACSINRRRIDLKAVLLMLLLQVLITWFMLTTAVGGQVIQWVSSFFLWLIDCSMAGIGFVFGGMAPAKGFSFLISVLLPIIFIVAFFDILTYFGILPLIINGLGWVLSAITRMPRFECFFATQVMFLGNNEVLAITRDQLRDMDDRRLLTACMLGMSCISVGVLGGYMQLIDPTYVLIAIPLNAVGALLITSIINPYRVPKEEDAVHRSGRVERRNFFDVITASMLTGGRLVLIIAAALMGFIALIACVNGILSVFHKSASLENLFGLLFSPFALLMGVEVPQLFTVARFMGEKLATNEFVAMGSLSPVLPTLSPHTEAVISSFLVSFCNFSTVGIIIGSVKALFDQEKTTMVARHTWRLLVSGLLVSFLTAMVVGLFVW